MIWRVLLKGWQMMKRIRKKKTSRQARVVAAVGERARISSSENTPPSYRRNRTLTGAQPETGTERTRAHHLRAVRRKLGITLMGVLVFIGVVGFGLSQFSHSVDISARNSEAFVRGVNTDLYQELFSTYYQRHPLERFRFLTNYNQLLNEMNIEAPEVEAIAPAGTAGIGSSRYELTLRQPVASWIVDGNRYYVDAQGVTFTRNYFAEPNVTVVDNSGAQVAEGSAIASGRLLSFVGRIVSLSADAGVEVEAIKVPSGSMRSVYVKVKGTPMTVRMTIDRGVEPQVQDMNAALRFFANRQKPEYIDVRVQGSAYYR